MDFRKLLDKVLRRTELNLAVAGAMVGSVQAMAKLFPETEQYSNLRVRLYKGGSWDLDCIGANGAPVDPWKAFLRWYHGRPQSDCFVMRYADGSSMIRRQDIESYTITNGTRAKRNGAAESERKEPK